MCSVLEIEAILIARARKKMREANVRLPRNEHVCYERMRHKEEDSFGSFRASSSIAKWVEDNPRQPQQQTRQRKRKIETT
jgi:hypothetical protein